MKFSRLRFVSTCDVLITRALNQLPAPEELAFLAPKINLPIVALNITLPYHTFSPVDTLNVDPALGAALPVIVNG